MTLSSDQLQQIVEAYADRMVDNMDTKTMEQFVFDTIMENLSIQSEEDILHHVSDYYDDEELSELIKEVGADPAVVLAD